ncbi:copper chaperone PCu(A)C [Roseovarius arcticus]|uniref:copper chaperone PCu(A)C n=1 Tax=Roseovarius arcticus TaxID=2547404 RepID=UPI0011109E64|nr:copper chaperone PCu(A)C [Roseovarius arcticus]
MAVETAATAKSTGGYLTITNHGDAEDALVGTKADFAKVMLHQSEEKDGVATMTHVERLVVPAGETIKLAPCGYHVMFMGLSDPFEGGTEVPATLAFEKAGDIDVVFNIEERGADTDHGDMDHSSHERIASRDP